ncbi:MAG TPA: LysM peptidoglycan-binding domain-containing protein [Vicinamibacterales bacterium]|nr:LysM peptidoglycan-binding domain-containing protein [Vicinamibacterales bacterium]
MSLLVVAGCASRSTTTAVAPVAPPPAAAAPAPLPPRPAAAPAVDPIEALIAESNRHFDVGQREIQAGHLEAARLEFNRALELVMQWNTGPRSDPRLREHFDRLVERVSAVEILALAEGDGFAEQRSEPAAIDALLDTPDTTVATAETARRAESDLESTQYDIPIPLNDRVLSYVELFSGRLKNYLEEGLGRGARYLPMVQEVFRAEGLPLDLAYVPLVESAFKPSALSRAKARGVWQFMSGTAIENGLQHDWYIDERADPEKATRAAAKYLKSLFDKFGDWHLALASYNGGPGRVQRAMTRSGRDDFWDISSSSRFLPRETRNYVPLILAAVIVARNPMQYGLEITPVVEPMTDVVRLTAPADLRRIAEWIDVPVQVLQDLNPELRRWTTPVRMTDYDLTVPMGKAEVLSARLADASPDDLAPLNRYSVRKGDTIATIARKLKVKRADLAQANYLSERARLAAGQQLIIPRAPTLLLAAGDRSEREPDAVVARDIDTGRGGPDTIVAVAPAPPRRASAEPSRVVHRVRSGETLSSIAQKYNTSVAAVRQANKLRGSVIKVGQRLTISVPRSVQAD